MNQLLRLSITTALIVFAACAASAEEEIKGRDIVKKGKVEVLTGELKADGNEWMLVVDNKEYELHLGPEKFREDKKVVLADGETAEVKGFVYLEHVSPISIKTEKQTIELRSEDGTAKWKDTEYSSQRSKETEEE